MVALVWETVLLLLAAYFIGAFSGCMLRKLFGSRAKSPVAAASAGTAITGGGAAMAMATAGATSDDGERFERALSGESFADSNARSGLGGDGAVERSQRILSEPREPVATRIEQISPGLSQPEPAAPMPEPQATPVFEADAPPAPDPQRDASDDGFVAAALAAAAGTAAAASATVFSRDETTAQSEMVEPETVQASAPEPMFVPAPEPEADVEPAPPPQSFAAPAEELPPQDAIGSVATRLTDTLSRGASSTTAAGLAAAAGATAAAMGAVALTRPSPAAENDLQDIRGIDGVRADRLRNMGVTRWDQISAWTAADVARFDGELGLGGAIQDQNWIEQASILAVGGTTAYAARRALGDLTLARPSSDSGVPRDIIASAAPAAAAVTEVATDTAEELPEPPVATGEPPTLEETVDRTADTGGALALGAGAATAVAGALAAAHMNTRETEEAPADERGVDPVGNETALTTGSAPEEATHATEPAHEQTTDQAPEATSRAAGLSAAAAAARAIVDRPSETPVDRFPQAAGSDGSASVAAEVSYDRREATTPQSSSDEPRAPETVDGDDSQWLGGAVAAAGAAAAAAAAAFGSRSSEAQEADVTPTDAQPIEDQSREERGEWIVLKPIRNEDATSAPEPVSEPATEAEFEAEPRSELTREDTATEPGAPSEDATPAESVATASGGAVAGALAAITGGAGAVAGLRSVRSDALTGGAPMPLDADDLKRIRGLGVRDETRLKAMGVATYSQIAGWTSDDVARVAGELGLGGRIGRENWIEQAQILAGGGGTTFSAPETAATRAGALWAAPQQPAEAGGIGGFGDPIAPEQAQPAPDEFVAAPVSDVTALANDAIAEAEASDDGADDEPRSSFADAITTIGTLGAGIGGGAAIAAGLAATDSPSDTAASEDDASTALPTDEMATTPNLPTSVPAASGSSFSGMRSVRSEALTGGMQGQRDDLKRIRGIGILIEKKLNGLGVTSYEQVANWTVADVARIDGTLGIQNRIEREKWIEQARILAAGGETEFSRRVDRGDV